MTATATPPRHRRAQARLLLASACATLLLGACSSLPPRSTWDMKSPDDTLLQKTGDAIVEESAAFAAHIDARRAQLERNDAAGPAIAAVAPVYDPLENRVVSISMYDADVGRLLWALADQLGMNLIVDPDVLALRQRATLQLRNVTAREVFDHILGAFDLHGGLRGGALVVSQMEERIFNVEMLNAVSSINLSTGGDVFGAGLQGADGGGGQSLRGTITLDGSVGKSNDPYKQLDAAVAAILAEDETQRGNDPDAPPPREASRYNLDPSTGSLFVRARPSQVGAIESLIEHNRRMLGRQVLVEAQILDVSLNDGSQFGVDWTLLRNRVAGIYGDNPINIPTFQRDFPAATEHDTLSPRQLIFPAQTLGSTGGRGLGIGYVGDTFAAALNVLRSFGDVKVLSNPSVRVRNGSPAYLSVGANIRYITKSTTSFSAAGADAFNQQSDIQTDSLFSGVVVGVAPFIHDNGNVELLVHPMQTEVEPGSLELVQFENGNAVSLPVINVKGISTTLNLRDGDTVMLGGLIDQQQTTSDSGIPGLSDVPGLGRLFGSRSKSQFTRELVLVLRVHVI
ncbi:pilus (MSHA type) biogenesis protein MshL [Coralloluteibacterium stylophorae]|uniref:Pilus (MSHA type) biogenesis protein MshL n=1 Tax=Coralloluteibacterium stylophorae TaxID=1776034 RepID=A0A8J8AXE9_9GAMM|nr:pilus (MSHA type) biogenesis protein MshL [Coralloluteibacterium stylophorae]MBS7456796.1 pilus (MSHA type) biogenesis protein MshL [Coralloluteibacterium stylophorae]